MTNKFNKDIVELFSRTTHVGYQGKEYVIGQLDENQPGREVELYSKNGSFAKRVSIRDLLLDEDLVLIVGPTEKTVNNLTSDKRKKAAKIMRAGMDSKLLYRYPGLVRKFWLVSELMQFLRTTNLDWMSEKILLVTNGVNPDSVAVKTCMEVIYTCALTVTEEKLRHPHLHKVIPTANENEFCKTVKRTTEIINRDGFNLTQAGLILELASTMTGDGLTLTVRYKNDTERLGESKHQWDVTDLLMIEV